MIDHLPFNSAHWSSEASLILLACGSLFRNCLGLQRAPEMGKPDAQVPGLALPLMMWSKILNLLEPRFLCLLNGNSNTELTAWAREYNEVMAVKVHTARDCTNASNSYYVWTTILHPPASSLCFWIKRGHFLQLFLQMTLLSGTRSGSGLSVFL